MKPECISHFLLFDQLDDVLEDKHSELLANDDLWIGEECHRDDRWFYFRQQVIKVAVIIIHLRKWLLEAWPAHDKFHKVVVVYLLADLEQRWLEIEIDSLDVNYITDNATLAKASDFL